MTINIASGERLIWQGTPKLGLHVVPQDLFAIPFAAIWLTGISSMLAATFTGQVRDVDPITYLILPFFVLIGLYILVGRFVVDSYARRRTRYILTDRRAIIESGLVRRNTRSISLAAAPEIRLRRGRGGKGTVEFGSGGRFGMLPRSWPGAGQFMPPAFDAIDDAERVYDLAVAAQRDAQLR